MHQIEDEDQEFHIQLSVCNLVEIWRSYAVSKCHLPAIEPRHPQPLYKIQGLGDWLVLKWTLRPMLIWRISHGDWNGYKFANGFKCQGEIALHINKMSNLFRIEGGIKCTSWKDFFKYNCKTETMCNLSNFGLLIMYMYSHHPTTNHKSFS